MSERRRLVVALAVMTAGAALVAAGLAGKLRRLLGPGAAEDLSAVTTLLPDSTLSLSRRSLRAAIAEGEIEETDVPEQALWSYFAEHHCGGGDVYRAAMDVAQDWRHLHRFLRALSTPPERMRAALTCGKALAERADGKQELRLRLPAPGDAEPHLLMLVALGAEPPAEAAAFRSLDAAPFEQGGCAPAWTAAADSDCSDVSRAWARLTAREMWIAGSTQALRAGAAAWPIEPVASLSRGLLAELAVSMHDDPVVELYLDARDAFPPERLHPGSWTKELGETRERLKKELHWGVHAAALGERPSSGGVRFRLELAAKGDAEASRIFEAMTAYRDQVMKAVDQGDPWRLRGASVRADFAAARNAANLRAWETASLTREGLRIVFRAEAQLDEAERRSYAHYRSWRRAHALAAARIVDDLLAGARPRPTDLVQLRGDELQERVRVGYKPFFAGDWSCNPEDGYRSFIESVAYEGESRSKRLGSFGYEIDERGLDAAALIQIDGASGRQELRLVESSSSIAVAGAGPAAKRVYCRPFGEEREHATPPPREALALNMLGRVRGFGLKGKLTSEPDPEWAEGRDTSIALDDAFAFEMGLASLPPRVWFLTTILGDGRVTHVYRVERDASWGIDSDFRRVETRFDDGEMQALVQALREERFFHQPLSIRNQSIVDGGYATLRLHTRSGSKVVTLENALPESMRKVMQLVATYLDARPGLGEQSTATGHLYHTLPERHVTATLRPDYVNDRDASVEVELVNVSEGGKVIGNSEGVWRASLDHFNPVELSVPVSAHEAIDPRQRYEMRARIVDGDRVLVGRAPAITDGRGQTADIALTGLMR